MLSIRASRFSAALAIAAITAACASTPEPAGAPTTTPPTRAAQGISVRVDNNSPDASTIIVHILPQAGVRRQLGEVEPAGTRTFAYQGVPGMYSLSAMGSNGREIRSNDFRVFENSVITWDLQRNNVRVSGR